MVLHQKTDAEFDKEKAKIRGIVQGRPTKNRTSKNVKRISGRSKLILLHIEMERKLTPLMRAVKALVDHFHGLSGEGKLEAAVEIYNNRDYLAVEMSRFFIDAYDFAPHNILKQND